jgi:predicted dehydrogenase
MLNWLVIGIGDITRKRVLPAILAEPRSRLYGVVSRDPRKVAPYGVQAWTDLAAALKDPAIDAVYVATPVFLHSPQTIASLKAGKHVLCEKPVAMNYSEACEMVRVAEETGRLLGVAYYRRLYPKVLRAKQLIAEGAIGQPLLAEINCHGWFDDEDGSRGWLLDPSKAGGGPLYDIGSHRIDVLNFLFGVPRKVCAQLSNSVHRTAVEDSATVLIEYECGVRGIVDVRSNSRVSRDQFRIIGVDGEMVFSPLNGPSLVYPRGREELPPHPNLHYPLIENFVSAVLDGTPLDASGESAIRTDWVTEQALAV